MRLLICTLYFPPCSLTPANRTFSWAKYLHQFGIYPVIITRQWPREFSPELYEEKSFGKKVIIEKHADYEVHYLPFTGNFRTRSLQKADTNKQKIPRRIFLLFELLLRNTFHSLLPYSNIFKYVLNYVAENKTDKILISGSPFQLFKIGYLAKKKYNIPWIADYRDGWTGGNHDNAISLLGISKRRSHQQDGNAMRPCTPQYFAKQTGEYCANQGSQRNQQIQIFHSTHFALLAFQAAEIIYVDGTQVTK